MRYYKAHIGQMYNRNVCYALVDLRGAAHPPMSNSNCYMGILLSRSYCKSSKSQDHIIQTSSFKDRSSHPTRTACDDLNGLTQIGSRSHIQGVKQ